jgi:hypothetical protein
MEHGRIVETGAEARGAARPTVRDVLLAGTALVIVGLAIVYIVFSAADSDARAASVTRSSC